MYATVYEPRSS